MSASFLSHNNNFPFSNSNAFAVTKEYLENENFLFHPHTVCSIQHQTTLDVENVNDLQVAWFPLSFYVLFILLCGSFYVCYNLKKFFLSLCDKKFTFCLCMALDVMKEVEVEVWAQFLIKKWWKFDKNILWIKKIVKNHSKILKFN